MKNQPKNQKIQSTVNLRSTTSDRSEATKSPGFAAITAQENGASPKGDRSPHVPLYWDQPHLLVIFPGG